MIKRPIGTGNLDVNRKRQKKQANRDVASAEVERGLRLRKAIRENNFVGASSCAKELVRGAGAGLQKLTLGVSLAK